MKSSLLSLLTNEYICYEDITLQNKILEEKSAENLTRCQILCPPNFCRIRYSITDRIILDTLCNTLIRTIYVLRDSRITHPRSTASAKTKGFYSGRNNYFPNVFSTHVSLKRSKNFLRLRKKQNVLLLRTLRMNG